MGCCLISLLSMVTPRIAMVFIWLLTDWFGRAYETRIWPILGFIAMPYSTLAYMAAMLNNDHQLSGGWLVLFIVTVIIDVGNWGGSRESCRRSQRRS